MHTPRLHSNLRIFSAFSVGKAFYYGLIAAALLIGSSAGAVDLTLAWDLNDDPTVAGYKLHYGTASGDYTASIDLGACESYVLTGLEPGQSYYFALTAYDPDGNESGYSNEVGYHGSNEEESRLPPSPTPWLILLLEEDGGGDAE